MRLQPWFQCETNLPGISEIYQKIGSRRVIFAANHRSNLDTFILISYIPGLRGMAKSSLFYNIFFAPIMWIIGFIPVEKGNLRSFLEGLALVRKKILDRNRSLLIFPETTRCQKGAVGVGKFSAAIFQLAVDSQAVIVPIALQNTDQLYGRGDLLLNPFQKTKVTMLEPIFPNQLPTTGQDQAEHLKDLVWNRISRELA